MMALAELLEIEAGDSATADMSVEISGINDDSRRVRPGDLFVAVAGAASDGHRFAANAVRRGAVAVAAEHELDAGQLIPDTVPVLLVRNLKIRRGALASTLYGHPSRQLRCVGVTGTNGKTSIACYLADMLARLGETAGYLGTIGWGTLAELEEAELTTESAIVVQQRLADLQQRGNHWVVMETSSHALDQHRVDAVAFEYAVFSNLSRDHLDYHDNLESYGNAKARLFGLESVRCAVINTDDPFGRRLVDGGGHAAVVTYGANSEADVRFENLVSTRRGVTGTWHTPWGVSEFHVPVFGGFSVANLSAAVAVLCQAGFEFEAVVRVAERVSPVPGRMEFFGNPGDADNDDQGDGPVIVVDFAHTPDALEKVLLALRPHVQGKLICVFGCGGDRDPGKRPMMARAARKHADVIWLTSDNPRSEDPQAILDEMRSGLNSDADGVSVHQQVDRRLAIEQAVSAANGRDMVVIAGKGHENYQEVSGRKLPFSDREVADQIVRRLSAERGC